MKNIILDIFHKFHTQYGLSTTLNSLGRICCSRMCITSRRQFRKLYETAADIISAPRSALSMCTQRCTRNPDYAYIIFEIRTDSVRSRHLAFQIESTSAIRLLPLHPVSSLKLYSCFVFVIFAMPTASRKH